MRLPRIAALTAAALLVLAACGDGDDVATPVPNGDDAPAVATSAPEEGVVETMPAPDEDVVEESPALDEGAVEE